MLNNHLPNKNYIRPIKTPRKKLIRLLIDLLLYKIRKIWWIIVNIIAFISFKIKTK